MQVEELQPKERHEMPVDNKQIFVVDDDRSVRRALKLLMLSHGFEVDTYSSAEEFFSAVPNSVPGCLLLDVHMPGLNGWETQKRLLKSGSKRPVIIISADQNDSIKEMALKAGAAGFLQKPINEQELIGLINKTN